MSRPHPNPERNDMSSYARAARRAAAWALQTAHVMLALWAGSAAAEFSWRSGYSLPYDTSDTALLTSAMVFAVLTAGAVVTLPEPWMTKARCAIKGSPVRNCPQCGGLATVTEMVEVRPSPLGPAPVFDETPKGDGR